MTLTKLGEQYIAQADAIKQQIECLREDMSHASGPDRRQTESKISALYKMATDCRLTGLYLTHYYMEGRDNGADFLWS